MGLFSPTSRNRMRLRLAPYDLVCAFAAPFVSMALRDPRMLAFDHWSDLLSAPFAFALISCFSAILSFLMFRLSDGMSRFFSVHDVMSVCGAVATTVASTSLFLFTFTRLEGIPRSTPLIFALVLGALLILGRAFHRVVTGEQDKVLVRSKPDQLRNIVVVGADMFSALAVKLIGAQNPPTARVVALLDERPDLVGRSVNGVRVVGLAHDLDAILAEYVTHGVEVDQVLVSDGRFELSQAALDSLRTTCEQREIEIVSLSEALNLRPKIVEATSPAPSPASAGVAIPAYFRVKRLIDVFAAIALLLVLSPVTLLVAGLVLIDVGTPLLFWQERIGRNGRRFLLYKFRTYYAPFDWRGDPVPEEDRLSRIGKFLRATRFDEIPQLLNILVGDMSLIGPRPLLPKDQPEDMSIRLMARPGITGWAQVNGGNLVTPDEKEALDAWYIQHCTPLIDLKILVQSLVIATTGERLDRGAIADALSWRAKLNPSLKPDAGGTGGAHP